MSKTPFVTLTGYTSVARHDELALVAAAAQTPLTVDIDAKDSSFRFYKGGILDTPNCGTAYNHVVVVAGYATDGGVDYYNVRNRWVSAVAAQHLTRAEDNCLCCSMQHMPALTCLLVTAGEALGARRVTFAWCVARTSAGSRKPPITLRA